MKRIDSPSLINTVVNLRDSTYCRSLSIILATIRSRAQVIAVMSAAAAAAATARWHFNRIRQWDVSIVRQRYEMQTCYSYTTLSG